MSDVDLMRPLRVALEERCDYADLRLVSDHELVLRLVAQGVETSDRTSYGAGLRALVRGGWGLASTCDVSWAGLEEAARTAAALAASSGLLSEGTAEMPRTNAGLDASWQHRVRRDPFEASQTDLRKLLVELDRALRSIDGVCDAVASLHLRERSQTMVTSAGARVEQQWVDTAVSLQVEACHGDDRVSGRSRAVHALGGLEVLEQRDAVAEAKALALATVERARTREVATTARGLVLAPSAVAVLVHESLAHYPWFDAPTTLPRLPDILSLTCDPTMATGLGSYGYDDVGQQAASWPLVEAGSVTTSTDWPAWRASGFAHAPMRRLTNLTLTPGDVSTDELLARVGSGLWADRPRCWEVDAARTRLRVTFDAARAVHDGSLGPWYRGAVLEVRLSDLWDACRWLGDVQSVMDVPMVCWRGEPPQRLAQTYRMPAAAFELED